MKNQFFSKDELRDLGIRFGKNCLIHKSSNIVFPKNLILENNVRVDAFTNIVNPQRIKLKTNVHIGPYCLLSANRGSITLENNSGLSAGVQIYTHSDDYTGTSFFGPFNKEISGKNQNIIISKFSLIGSNSIILPGAKIPEGVSVGALSLVNTVLKKWSIYSGNPIKFILPRKKKIKKKIK